MTQGQVSSSSSSSSQSSAIAPQTITPAEAERTPRFGRLLTSVLGSPFLTTSDLPPDDPREDMERVDGAFAAVSRELTVTRPASPTPSFRTENYSIINWDPAAYASIYAVGDATAHCSSAFLAGSRRTVAGYPSSWPPPPPSSAGQLKPSKSLTLGIIPRIWDALREGSPGRKGKRRLPLPSSSSWREHSPCNVTVQADDEDVDYLNMIPLDGEEGELIDDEACFISVRAVTGVDIIALLPTELALHLLSFLDLPAVLACLRVSRTWHRLARDNAVWAALFAQRAPDGWRVDLRRARVPPRRSSLSRSPALLASPSHPHILPLPSHAALTRAPAPTPTPTPAPTHPAPLAIDWRATYRTRAELARRWGPGGGDPCVRRLSGHADSVYCLEFDGARIVTGSRDRTIKVWALRSGRCLGTFAGHRGSVLCLKFDRDWDAHGEGEGGEGDVEGEGKRERGVRKGFMVSGSSDCTVCVWEVSVAQPGPGEERGEQPVTAEIKAVLRGHSGGVLDLRIDDKWIVSCSKDALIRVWDRKTLGLHCTFRGHEGPVNAVGLQGDRVASASGDGKMMLWDITTGERLRTFEGHDRGLACIEFKDDLIVSGSNDWKIKVWSASTGACLRTLVGHEQLVRALSFDPRSGRLVSGSYDKTVKVWDLHTGQKLREFRGCHESHIFDVKFDHCRIISTSHDQNIVVLDFSEGLDVSLFA